jgi:hypothetical protein
VRIVFAEIAVAQICMGVKLQDDEVLVPAEQRADGAGGQRVLTPEHEREFAGGDDGRHQVFQLFERGSDRPSDRRFAQRGYAIVEVSLPAQLFIVELELLTGLQDGTGSRPRTRAVADGGLEAKRYDNGTSRGWLIRVGPHGIKKTLRGRQIIERCAHA